MAGRDVPMRLEDLQRAFVVTRTLTDGAVTFDLAVLTPRGRHRV